MRCSVCCGDRLALRLRQVGVVALHPADLGELLAVGLLEFLRLDLAVADGGERVVVADIADHVRHAPQAERADQHDEEDAGSPGPEERAEEREHQWRVQRSVEAAHHRDA